MQSFYFKYRFGYPKLLAGLTLVLIAAGCDIQHPESTDFKSRINDPVQDYRQLTDIEYGPEPFQDFDIALPVSVYNNPADVVILLHGGNWTGGEKWFLQPSVDSLVKARKNLAVVNINYSIAARGRKTLFECQIEDIGRCVDYLKENAERFNIRKDRFAIMGASAGGHLALAYSYLDEQKNIHTVIGMSSITELTVKELSTEELWHSIQVMAGQQYGEADDLKLRAASPVYLATIFAPKTILLYGANDDVVFKRQQTLLREKLLALRVPNALYVYKGETHNVSAGLVAKSILAALGATEYNTYLRDTTLH